MFPVCDGEEENECAAAAVRVVLLRYYEKKLPNDKDVEHWDKFLMETVKSLQSEDFKNGLDTHCLGVTQVCFDSARVLD